MAAFETTTPDNIAKATNASPASLVQVSQTMGDSIQTALSKRERYDYVWANSSERTAQTGMVLSSRGYQTDTKSEYIYDGANWALARPYAEFTASQSMVDGSAQPLGTFSNDAVNSTSTTFVTPGASGIVTLVDPGIYAVYSVTQMASPATSSMSVDLRLTSSVGTILHRQPMPINEFIGGNVAPALLTTTTNTPLWFGINKATGGSHNVTTRVRIARLG